MKKYDEYILEAEKKRQAKLEGTNEENNPKTISSLRKAKIMESLEDKAMKVSMIEKRKQYGDFVRETYAPKIEHRSEPVDQAKISRYNSKITDKKESKKTKEKIIENSPNIAISDIQMSPKKIKKKKISTIIESKTPEIKPEPKLDYLTEIRLRRSELNDGKSIDSALSYFEKISLSEDKSRMLKKLKKYEKIANIEEYKMKNIDFNNPEVIQLEEKINEILMQSVRAKINMLEHK